MNTKSSIVFKQLKYFILFSAFPSIILIQNISFYFFLNILYKDKNKFINLFRIENIMDKGALLFIFASITSVIFSPINNMDDIIRSIKVLPNYIYWGVSIIVLPRLIISNKISLLNISKFVVFGIILTILSYFPLHYLFDLIPIYQNMSPNAFAFLLIIFGPLVVNYFHKEYEHSLLTISIAISLTLCGFISGSRSGSILVLIGSFSVIFLNNKSLIFYSMIASIILFLITPTLLESPIIKDTIFNLNERTYSLIYERTETLNNDYSYLTRLAMIEKGKVIFNKYPITGIGLNNFMFVDYDFNMDFEGGDLLDRLYSEHLKSTNPHNSYLSFLTEGGILLIIPALILMFYPVFFFLFNFKKMNSTEISIIIGIVCMCIHAYFIAGMVNSFAWLLISLSNAVIITIENKNANRLSLSRSIPNY